jgi:hypothetical protein
MKYEREERSTETIGVVRCALSAFWEKKTALSIHSAANVTVLIYEFGALLIWSFFPM